MARILRYLFIFLIIGVIGALSYSTYYFYSQNKKAQSLVSNPQEISKLEIADIVSKISKFMSLPAEEPSLATVLEADKLKDQPFFAKAENGDKVLIYAVAKKAILYRPSTNMVIDVNPLYLDETKPSPTPTIKMSKTTKPAPTEDVSATPSAAPTN